MKVRNLTLEKLVKGNGISPFLSDLNIDNICLDELDEAMQRVWNIELKKLKIEKFTNCLFNEPILSNNSVALLKFEQGTITNFTLRSGITEELTITKNTYTNFNKVLELIQRKNDSNADKSFINFGNNKTLYIRLDLLLPNLKLFISELDKKYYLLFRFNGYSTFLTGTKKITNFINSLRSYNKISLVDLEDWKLKNNWKEFISGIKNN